MNPLRNASAALALAALSMACRTVPDPPSDEALQLAVTEHGIEDTLRNNRLKVLGTPITGYRVQAGSSRASRQPAGLFLSKSPDADEHISPWKRYLSWATAASGLLLGATVPPVAAYDQGEINELVIASTAAPLALLGISMGLAIWYQSDMPGAAQAYNEALEERVAGSVANTQPRSPTAHSMRR